MKLAPKTLNKLKLMELVGLPRKNLSRDKSCLMGPTGYLLGPRLGPEKPHLVDSSLFLSQDAVIKLNETENSV